MLTIKSYQDGDRFVIVFEGLSNIPSEQDMIKQFLCGITNTVISDAPAAEAKPIPADDKKTDIPTEVFPSGTFKGKTPAEVLSEGKTKGFMYLAGIANDTDIPSNLLADIRSVICGYLKQFSECDEENYSKKLKTKQLDMFFAQYEAILPQDIRDKISINKRNNLSEEEKRAIVAQSIRHFKTIAK